jgi:hypothetical protein
MSVDTAGLNLREPEKMDWDNYNPGTRYMPAPQAGTFDATGKYVEKVFFGQLPTNIVQEVNQKTELRQYLLDPIKLVRSGEADGYEIRFTRAGVKMWVNSKTGKPMNASMVGNLLKSVGITAKPQRTAEYDAAMKLAAGKVAAFTIDWEAKNSETGEKVEGYVNFPDDPARPGQKKAVLKEGDVYRTKEGLEAKVTSPVLFANARVKFFVDPNRK